MKLRKKIISSIYVELEKTNNGLMICYSNPPAKYSSHEVAKAVAKKIKEHSKDFNITNVKIELKLKNKEADNA